MHWYYSVLFYALAYETIWTFTMENFYVGILCII